LFLTSFSESSAKIDGSAAKFTEKLFRLSLDLLFKSSMTYLPSWYVCKNLTSFWISNGQGQSNFPRYSFFSVAN
jgi:hypothetical protein